MTKTKSETKLRLDRTALSALRSHARRAAPEECCGALLADAEGRIARAIPVENESSRPGSRYLIGPETVQRLDRMAARQGLRVAGYYHSHADGSVTPSPYDLESAWPRLVYLIVGSDGLRAWSLRDDRSAFDEIDVALPGQEHG